MEMIPCEVQICVLLMFGVIVNCPKYLMECVYRGSIWRIKFTFKGNYLVFPSGTSARGLSPSTKVHSSHRTLLTAEQLHFNEHTAVPETDNVSSCVILECVTAEKQEQWTQGIQTQVAVSVLAHGLFTVPWDPGAVCDCFLSSPLSCVVVDYRLL